MVITVRLPARKNSCRFWALPGWGEIGGAACAAGGGGGWEPSARIRAIRSQLRTRAGRKRSNSGGKRAAYNLGCPSVEFHGGVLADASLLLSDPRFVLSAS